MLLHLLYSKPTHALLLNTLSHPHFKTLKLFKKCFVKTLKRFLTILVFQNVDGKVCLKEVHELVLNKVNVIKVKPKRIIRWGKWHEASV
jgi:hypothetical protein